MSMEEKIFQNAVNLLGNPLNEWKFIGIEFNDDTPHLKYYPPDGQIAISLSMRAKENDQQYYFQLTHEICHLFYPKMEFPSLIEHTTLLINEGISTYFSIKTTGGIYNIENHLRNDLKQNSIKYHNALELVEHLIILYPNAIRKLRDEQPRIDLLTDEDFAKAKINADTNLIRALLSPF
jgi:hypothetical protein